MAAAAPRKRTVRPKTRPTAKAATPDPASDTDAIEAYAELRERARRSGLQMTRKDAGPYVIPGFDPPIEARWPGTLLGREDFDVASRRMDIFGMLRILLAPDDYRRVLARFDEFADGDDLLIGLTMRIIDHVNGPGASEVPGGSTAS